jgi:pimeloyl-[acyl-carrier protein] methyl ester esterase
MNNIHLVLLPGMDGTGLLFEPLLAVLPPEISAQVVTYPTDTPLSYRELFTLVKAALPSERQYLLLGESFSGPLALMAAADQPQGLKGVILCASFIRNPIFYLPKWASIVANGSLFRLAPSFLTVKTLLSGYSSSSLRALISKAQRSVLPSVMALRAREILRVNAEHELKNIKMPLLYLWGSSDIVVPRRSLRQILHLRPETKVSIIPGPHLVLQVNPKESIAAIMAFAGSHVAF